MNSRRAKVVAASLGGAAAIGLAIGGAACGLNTPLSSIRAGSGDSATATNYVPPSVSSMILTPAMSTGQTQTPSSVTTAVAAATPTVTVSAVAPCASNGVVLPGGCH
jgi:hypothetical protein